MIRFQFYYFYGIGYNLPVNLSSTLFVVIRFQFYYFYGIGYNQLVQVLQHVTVVIRFQFYYFYGIGYNIRRKNGVSKTRCDSLSILLFLRDRLQQFKESIKKGRVVIRFQFYYFYGIGYNFSI